MASRVYIAVICLASFLCFLTLYSRGPHLFNFQEETAIPSSAYVRVIDPGDGKKWPYRVFKSSPLRPPNLTITGNGNALANGYVFLTPKDRKRGGVEQHAPYIFDTDGELVFAANFSGESGTTDFRVQEVDGTPHLTFWQGSSTHGSRAGHGYGEVVFLDEEYNENKLSLRQLDIKTLKPTEVIGVVDLHEHQMTPWNSILVTVFNNTPADLSSVGGPQDGWVANSMVFEIDVQTQEVLFSWSPLDHVLLNESHLPVKSYMGDGTKNALYDFFHVNSIQAVDEDRLLINSRHMWTTYLLSRKDGHIIWRIDGETGGDFGTLPENGHFAWQHHARAHNVTETSMMISWFNNHFYRNSNPTAPPTSGLVMELSLPPDKTTPPRLVRNFVLPDEHLHSGSQGSHQAVLENGNSFIGYGELPVALDYGPGADGSEVRWKARFGHDGYVHSFRAFKHTWQATPKTWNPSLFVELDEYSSDGIVGVHGYASWNGATEISKWNVYTGSNKDDLHKMGLAMKYGFETRFEIDVVSDGCVQVGTVLPCGKERRSNVACI